MVQPLHGTARQQVEEDGVGNVHRAVDDVVKAHRNYHLSSAATGRWSDPASGPTQALATRKSAVTQI